MFVSESLAVLVSACTTRAFEAKIDSKEAEIGVEEKVYSEYIGDVNKLQSTVTVLQ